MNERLRAAMVQAKLSVDDVYRATQVDPKTVQRWLHGRIPHQRHRWTVSKLVNEDEAYLWPTSERELSSKSTSTAELVALYAHRSDAPSELWTRLIDDARESVDILGYAVQFLPEMYAGFATRMVAKAEAGAKVRLAIVEPDSEELAARDAEEGLSGGLIARVRTTIKHIKPMLQSPDVEVRFHTTPMYNSVFRFDDQMLVTPHLYARPGYQVPMLHLRRVGAGGAFDNYLQHFDDVWTTGQPAA